VRGTEIAVAQSQHQCRRSIVIIRERTAEHNEFTRMKEKVLHLVENTSSPLDPSAVGLDNPSADTAGLVDSFDEISLKVGSLRQVDASQSLNESEPTKAPFHVTKRPHGTSLRKNLAETYKHMSTKRVRVEARKRNFCVQDAGLKSTVRPLVKRLIGSMAITGRNANHWLVEPSWWMSVMAILQHQTQCRYHPLF